MRPAPALKIALLAAASLVGIAAPASADLSKVLSVSLETLGPSGGPATLSVDAINAGAPVNGMVLRLDGQDVFGLAACRTESPGAVAAPPFAPGSRVRLAAPIASPGNAGTPALVRVDSGGCQATVPSVGQPVTVVPPPSGQTLVDLLLGTPLPIGDLLPLGVVSAARKGEPGCRGARRRPGRSIRRRREAKRAVLCLVNRARRQNGRRSLATNARLGRAAYFHSKKMVRGRFFAHVQPGGRGLESRLFANRYLSRRLGGWRAGENIGFGRRSYSTPKAMFRAWMASSGHRANILDPLYREVGIGLVPGTPSRHRGITFTTDFGLRRKR